MFGRRSRLLPSVSRVLAEEEPSCGRIAGTAGASRGFEGQQQSGVSAFDIQPAEPCRALSAAVHESARGGVYTPAAGQD